MLQELSSNTVYAVGLPIAFGLIFLEAIYSAWTKKGIYNIGDSLGSLGLFMGNIFMVLGSKGLIFGLYLVVFQYNVFDLSDYLPF